MGPDPDITGDSVSITDTITPDNTKTDALQDTLAPAAVEE